MDVLIVDLKGKFAHFRKFYTNSSSLSYSVPPRTVIEGIIAAILGIERDDYYNLFNEQRFNIAVRKMNSTYKVIQTVNYMKATNPKGLIEPKEHTQIPFEIVMSKEDLCYRLYLSHTDLTIIDELEKRIKSRKYCYIPYMGCASFNCKLEFAARVDAAIIEPEQQVSVVSLVDISKIVLKSIGFSNADYNLIKEKMPADYYANRVISRIGSYVFDENCNPLNLKLNEKCINVSYNDINENIVFM